MILNPLHCITATPDLRPKNTQQTLVHILHSSALIFDAKLVYFNNKVLALARTLYKQPFYYHDYSVSCMWCRGSTLFYIKNNRKLLWGQVQTTSVCWNASGMFLKTTMYQHNKFAWEAWTIVAIMDCSMKRVYRQNCIHMLCTVVTVADLITRQDRIQLWRNSVHIWSS